MARNLCSSWQLYYITCSSILTLKCLMKIKDTEEICPWLFSKCYSTWSSYVDRMIPVGTGWVSAWNAIFFHRNIFLGETFSSYISVHNDSNQVVKDILVKVSDILTYKAFYLDKNVYFCWALATSLKCMVHTRLLNVIDKHWWVPNIMEDTETLFFYSRSPIDWMRQWPFSLIVVVFVCDNITVLERHWRKQARSHFLVAGRHSRGEKERQEALGRQAGFRGRV